LLLPAINLIADRVSWLHDDSSSARAGAPRTTAIPQAASVEANDL